MSELYSGTRRARLGDIGVYEERVGEMVPAGAEVTLTGHAPVWLYLRVAHALHGTARRLLYDSPVTGPVEIFNHDPR